MLFPDTADRSWRYGTTNAQYGNFYGMVIREVVSLGALHLETEIIPQMHSGRVHF